jgi:hypothetical protein
MPTLDDYLNSLASINFPTQTIASAPSLFSQQQMQDYSAYDYNGDTPGGYGITLGQLVQSSDPDTVEFAKSIAEQAKTQNIDPNHLYFRANSNIEDESAGNTKEGRYQNSGVYSLVDNSTGEVLVNNVGLGKIKDVYDNDTAKANGMNTNVAFENDSIRLMNPKNVGQKGSTPGAVPPPGDNNPEQPGDNNPEPTTPGNSGGGNNSGNKKNSGNGFNVFPYALGATGVAGVGAGAIRGFKAQGKNNTLADELLKQNPTASNPNAWATKGGKIVSRGANGRMQSVPIKGNTDFLTTRYFNPFRKPFANESFRNLSRVFRHLK